MERHNQHIDRETLTHNLLWLRKKRGYSQKTMAQLMGIGVKSLRALERGELPPRLTVACLPPVCRHFQISLSELFGTWLD